MGELAIGRARCSWRAVGDPALFDYQSSRRAGLIGAVQLAPSWVLDGHDAVLRRTSAAQHAGGLLKFKVKNAEVLKAES